VSRYLGIYAGFSLLCAVLVAIRPLNFLSDDALFYLVIAQHIVENGYLNGEVIRLDGALRMPPR